MSGTSPRKRKRRPFRRPPGPFRRRQGPFRNPPKRRLNARKRRSRATNCSPTPRRIMRTSPGIRIASPFPPPTILAVLTAAGDVYAFGSNARGQLGVAMGSAVDHSALAQDAWTCAGKRLRRRRRRQGVASASRAPRLTPPSLNADGDAFQWGHGVPGGPRRVDVGVGLVHRDGGGSPAGSRVLQGVTSRATPPEQLIAVAAGATTSLAPHADGAVLAWRMAICRPMFARARHPDQVSNSPSPGR